MPRRPRSSSKRLALPSSSSNDRGLSRFISLEFLQRNDPVSSPVGGRGRLFSHQSSCRIIERPSFCFRRRWRRLASPARCVFAYCVGLVNTCGELSENSGGMAQWQIVCTCAYKAKGRPQGDGAAIQAAVDHQGQWRRADGYQAGRKPGNRAQTPSPARR